MTSVVRGRREREGGEGREGGRQGGREAGREGGSVKVRERARERVTSTEASNGQ